MDDSPEVIRHRMEETRASLTDKLEQLEHQVVDTVQEATSAVAETVGTVKEAVHDTVATVKETFDFRRQTERHPWVVLGCSIVCGYICGRLFERLEAEPEPASGAAAQPTPTRKRIPTSLPAPWAERIQGFAPPSVPEDRNAGATDDGLLAEVTSKFQPEIDKLKSLAIGAAMGLMRDVVLDFAPESMRPQIAEVIDGVTVKLDGQPVAGLLTPEGESHEERYTSEMGRSMGSTQRPSEGDVGQGDGRRFAAGRGQL